MRYTTPYDLDNETLGIIMSEETLTDEQYGQGDHLLLLANRDMWRAYAGRYLQWFPTRNLWVYVAPAQPDH